MRTTERLTGVGCTYLLDGGGELRVHLPTQYSDADLAGLRALDLASLGAGRAAVGPPDGAGRASYSSTSGGETLIASSGGMQLVLALRSGLPPWPAGIRAGMARVAAGVIDRSTPEVNGGIGPPIPLPGVQSLSRDLCPDAVGVAQLEERTGLLVNESVRDARTSSLSCRFFVDEPDTVEIGVRVTDESGQRSAEDSAALRRLDLAAAPVTNLDATADDDWPRYGSTYTVRYGSTTYPDTFAVKARAGGTRVEVWYFLHHPDRGAGAVGDVRPGLLALAGQVIANL